LNLWSAKNLADRANARSHAIGVLHDKKTLLSAFLESLFLQVCLPSIELTQRFFEMEAFGLKHWTTRGKERFKKMVIDLADKKYGIEVDFVCANSKSIQS